MLNIGCDSHKRFQRVAGRLSDSGLGARDSGAGVGPNGVRPRGERRSLVTRHLSLVTALSTRHCSSRPRTSDPGLCISAPVTALSMLARHLSLVTCHCSFRPRTSDPGLRTLGLATRHCP
jgi:hypothetical protein